MTPERKFPSNVPIYEVPIDTIRNIQMSVEKERKKEKKEAWKSA